MNNKIIYGNSAFGEAFEELDRINEGYAPATIASEAEAAEANKAYKDALANEHIIYLDFFHKAYDKVLQDEGLLDCFETNGDLKRSSYGIAKEADTHGKRILKNMWIARFGTGSRNRAYKNPEDKAERDARDEAEAQASKQREIEFNNKKNAIIDADLARLNAKFDKMAPKLDAEGQRLAIELKAVIDDAFTKVDPDLIARFEEATGIKYEPSCEVTAKRSRRTRPVTRADLEKLYSRWTLGGFSSQPSARKASELLHLEPNDIDVKAWLDAEKTVVMRLYGYSVYGGKISATGLVDCISRDLNSRIEGVAQKKQNDFIAECSARAIEAADVNPDELFKRGANAVYYVDDKGKEISFNRIYDGKTPRISAFGNNWKEKCEFEGKLRLAGASKQAHSTENYSHTYKQWWSVISLNSKILTPEQGGFVNGARDYSYPGEDSYRTYNSLDELSARDREAAIADYGFDTFVVHYSSFDSGD